MLSHGPCWRYHWLKWCAIANLVFGQRERAIACFDRMLCGWPADAYALASRAHVQAQLGRRDGALADALALTSLHPRRRADDWFNLAFLLDETGRLADAEAAFRTAVEIDPSLDRAWYGLGLVLIRQQRHGEAVVALRRNTELQPMCPHGWYQLAHVMHQQQEPEEARRIVRHLRGFEPALAARLQRETGL